MILKEKGHSPTPAKPATGVGVVLEYRMRATRPDGRLNTWCFKKRPQAEKHLADLVKDIAERPLCGYTDPYLEAREVGNWVKI